VVSRRRLPTLERRPLPEFDKDGKVLYFTASTDLDWPMTWLDLSGFQRPVSRNVYAAVLRKGDPNPIEPQSDDEKLEGAKSDDKSRASEKKDNDKEKETKTGEVDKAKENGQRKKR